MMATMSQRLMRNSLGGVVAYVQGAMRAWCFSAQAAGGRNSYEEDLWNP